MTRIHLLALIRSYIAQYDLELQNAVLLLGGSAALMRLQRFRRALSVPKPKILHLQRELTWLCDLLSLEFVGDIDSDESGYFAAISPNDDAVWMICLLTDIAKGILDGFDEISEANIDDQNEVAA
jgi:hypothetical protein